jgi:hypothetical protein
MAGFADQVVTKELEELRRDQLQPHETVEAEMLHRLALIEAHLIELVRVIKEIAREL